MNASPKPKPAMPDLLRTPSGRFGWIEDRLLREGWLARAGPEATTLLVLLALAADRHGASYYGREQMARSVGLSRAEVDQALQRLLALGLLAHRPWSNAHCDGVWQLLPVPKTEKPRVCHPVRLREILPDLEVG